MRWPRASPPSPSLVFAVALLAGGRGECLGRAGAASGASRTAASRARARRAEPVHAAVRHRAGHLRVLGAAAQRDARAVRAARTGTARRGRQWLTADDRRQHRTTIWGLDRQRRGGARLRLGWVTGIISCVVEKDNRSSGSTRCSRRSCSARCRRLDGRAALDSAPRLDARDLRHSAGLGGPLAAAHVQGLPGRAFKLPVVGEMAEQRV